MLEPRRVIAFAATLVISVLVSLLVDRPARAHDMDALYQAAKQEGALNLYGGGPAASFTARAKKFEQRFPGITVNVVGGFSNRLTGQIDAARKAGKPHADLAMLQTIQNFVQWKREGVLLAFKPDGWETIADQFKDPDGTFMGHYVTLLAYAYRPDLVNVTVRSAPISSLRRSRTSSSAPIRTTTTSRSTTMPA